MAADIAPRPVPGSLFFASALAVVALIARRGRATSWPTLAWLAVFFLIGVYAQRGIAWWPLAAVPRSPGRSCPVRDADDPSASTRRVIRRLNVVVAGVLVVVGVALLPGVAPDRPGTEAAEPAC